MILTTLGLKTERVYSQSKTQGTRQCVTEVPRNGRPAEYRCEKTARRCLQLLLYLPCRKVWLTPTVRVPCSNAANIERKTWTQSELCTWQNCVREQQPQKCTSPEDGQTLCKVWLTSVERRRCSNEVKTRNSLKFAGVPLTNESVSATSGPKFTIL